MQAQKTKQRVLFVGLMFTVVLSARLLVMSRAGAFLLAIVIFADRARAPLNIQALALDVEKSGLRQSRAVFIEWPQMLLKQQCWR